MIKQDLSQISVSIQYTGKKHRSKRTESPDIQDLTTRSTSEAVDVYRSVMDVLWALFSERSDRSVKKRTNSFDLRLCEQELESVQSKGGAVRQCLSYQSCIEWTDVLTSHQKRS